MSQFDYDNVELPDEDTVAAVVAEINGTGKPPPLSDEELEQREIWREQQIRLAEERRLEYERRQAEAAEAERAELERRAAIARSEERKRIDAELREQIGRRGRDRSLTSLLDHAIEQKQFRQAALRSAAHANARQRLKSILNPPPPPEPVPEPEIDPDPIGSYFGEPGFSVELWTKRRRNRSWW